MANPVKPRRLVFFVCDDNAILESEDALIEIWRPEDEDRESDAASVSGWLEHCEHAFRHKQVEFDALSIDVFFDDDNSDPAKALKGGAGSTFAGHICSGFYHGLTALARRRTHTEDGNAMPFAWEIRTASPGMDLTPEQEVEVVRVYALLLAITKPYCADAGFLGLERKADPMSWPSDLVLRAFREQEKRPGAGIDIANSLLPQWRKRFTESVRAREVRIGISELQNYLKTIDHQNVARGLDPHRVFEGPDAVVPILNRGNRISDAILLSSIFADFDGITAEDWSTEIRTWIVGLTSTQSEDLTGSTGAMREWVLAAKAYFSKDDDENLADRQIFENLSESKQCLIFVTYYIAATLDKRRFPFPSKQDLFSAAVGIEDIHPHVWIRIFEKSDHVWIDNLTDLKSVVLAHLGNAGLQLPFTDNFCRALGILLCDLELVGAVKAGFPALVPFLPQTARDAKAAATRS